MPKDVFLADTIVSGTEVKRYGVHLLIDGYNGSTERLSNTEEVRKFLLELAALLEKRVLSQPMAGTHPIDHEAPESIAAAVLLSNGHISIHTLPDQGFLSADIYAARTELAVDKILPAFQNHFELLTLDSQVINRGVYYPD